MANLPYKPYYPSLPYFLVDKLIIAKNIFRLAIFNRKIGRKITFDFEGPWNPVDTFDFS